VDTRQLSMRLGAPVSWRRSTRPLAGACASAYAPRSTQFGLMCGAFCAFALASAVMKVLAEGQAERTWSWFSGRGSVWEASQKGCPGRGVASFRRCVIMCARSVPGRQTEREFIRICTCIWSGRRPMKAKSFSSGASARRSSLWRPTLISAGRRVLIR